MTAAEKNLILARMSADATKADFLNAFGMSGQWPAGMPTGDAATGYAILADIAAQTALRLVTAALDMPIQGEFQPLTSSPRMISSPGGAAKRRRPRQT